MPSLFVPEVIMELNIITPGVGFKTIPGEEMKIEIYSSINT